MVQAFAKFAVGQSRTAGSSSSIGLKSPVRTLKSALAGVSGPVRVGPRATTPSLARAHRTPIRCAGQARRAEAPTRPAVRGEDPDIAGIVPGPQPPQEDY